MKGIFRGDYEIKFDFVTDQMRRAHGDQEVATENGAYGVAILLVDKNTKLTVFERSRKGTGFDYWLGLKGKTGPYFQSKARLEVSGIRNGTDVEIEYRVKRKLKQVNQSNGILPAYVVVVEFSLPKAKVVKR